MNKNNIYFDIVQSVSGIKYAEVSSESKERLYQYRINAAGNVQAGVNRKAVEFMPKTITTKRLTIALDKIKNNLVKMINLYPSDSPEYRELFWTIKEALENM